MPGRITKYRRAFVADVSRCRTLSHAALVSFSLPRQRERGLEVEAFGLPLIIGPIVGEERATDLPPRIGAEVHEEIVIAAEPEPRPPAEGARLDPSHAPPDLGGAISLPQTDTPNTGGSQHEAAHAGWIRRWREERAV